LVRSAQRVSTSLDTNGSGLSLAQSPFASSAVEKCCESLAQTADCRHKAEVTFWAYMLRCADGRYYTGHTDNLDRRTAEHHTGGFCDFTSRRRPVVLVWSETFPTRLEALEAERRVGGWSRAKKEALIRGDWSSVSHFARPPRERVSTSLDTNGVGGTQSTPPEEERVSMTLDTSGLGNVTRPPFASSEVEKRCSTP
jgi:putative endonuclease